MCFSMYMGIWKQQFIYFFRFFLQKRFPVTPMYSKNGDGYSQAIAECNLGPQDFNSTLKSKDRSLPVPEDSRGLPFLFLFFNF